MINFGFGLSPSSTVNLDKTDLSLLSRVRSLEPDVDICMACGSCTASCTAGPFTGMSVRKVINDLQRGRNKDIEKMISGCMLCGKCTMVCPRGINTRHLILSVWRVYNKEEVVK